MVTDEWYEDVVGICRVFYVTVGESLCKNLHSGFLSVNDEADREVVGLTRVGAGEGGINSDGSN